MKFTGFTLIEILMVCVLLGILAAVIVPQSVGFSDEAKMTRRDLDVSMLQKLVVRYRIRNGAYPAVLTDLIAGGLTRDVPINPVTELAYNYNAVTGEVTP